jgi:hypothetical protein
LRIAVERPERPCILPVHRTLRVTSAMQAGLADRVWEIKEIVGLLERAEREPAA